MRLLGQLCVGLIVGVAMIPGAGVGVPVIIAVVGATAWFLLYVNAFNFMDGVNGISGLQAAVVGAAFVGIGTLWDVPGVMGWGAAIAGASIAFLPYNAVRARVFLGDAGSYGLGAAIALLTVHAWTSGVPAWAALAPSLIYCADVLTTLCRRFLAHESVLDAHRSHIYQRLTDAGLSHVQVAGFVAAASALCAGAALAAADESARPWSLALAALVLTGYLLSPHALHARRAHDYATTAGSR
jgi:UDP-N-acetylmuramyl pentapeptide phosphotransferase/UDP-N-acetylglucosamine-1-phosphate transferase